MKKIVLFLLVFCFGFTLIRFNVSAEAYDALPIGKNYLNLSNLMMIPGDSGYAFTQEMIRVEAYHQYTIVLDYGFIGQHSSWLGDIYIGIEEYPSQDS